MSALDNNEQVFAQRVADTNEIVRDFPVISFKSCKIHKKSFLIKSSQNAYSAENMWCVARFGTISIILKTWKTPMEEC